MSIASTRDRCAAPRACAQDRPASSCGVAAHRPRSSGRRERRLRLRLRAHLLLEATARVLPVQPPSVGGPPLRSGAVQGRRAEPDLPLAPAGEGTGLSGAPPRWPLGRLGRRFPHHARVARNCLSARHALVLGVGDCVDDRCNRRVRSFDLHATAPPQAEAVGPGVQNPAA